MDNNFISTLQKKEQELTQQLEGLRTTIALFLNGSSNESPIAKAVETTVNTAVPLEYSEELTWKEKVLFALGVIEKGFVTDIVRELKKYSSLDESFLIKRITITASNMKTDGVLDAAVFGRKFKYFIK